jgi:hypothetical protein
VTSSPVVTLICGGAFLMAVGGSAVLLAPPGTRSWVRAAGAFLALLGMLALLAGLVSS